MMRMDDNINTEFEKLLRSKMDELASQVDVFDKIEKRAFSKTENDFAEDECTITELENVTGRRHRFRWTALAAIAAAIVLCIFFLPKNAAFMNFAYSIIGKSDKQLFRQIINEIAAETEQNEYLIYDCTLEEYLKYDVLITPLQRCPFEQKEQEDINVRIFVKTYNDIPTNQVYAVEYEGKYDDGCYLAAADSKSKFTADELEKLSDFPEAPDFETRLNNKYLDDPANTIIAAGFDYSCIYKYNDMIYNINNHFIYLHQNEDTENLSYIYDISTNNADAPEQSFDTTVFDEDSWNSVVYFNSTSARTEEELSCFTRARDIFDYSSDNQEELSCICPFNYSDEEKLKTDFNENGIRIINSESEIARILPPFEPSFRSSFCIYILQNESDSYEIISDDWSMAFKYDDKINIYESFDSRTVTGVQNVSDEESRAVQQAEKERIAAQKAEEERIAAQKAEEERIALQKEEEKQKAEEEMYMVKESMAENK